MEDNKGSWNPLFSVSHGTIGCPVALSGQLPLISIQRNWQMFFELMDDLEFDGIEVSMGLNDLVPKHGDQDAEYWNQRRPIALTEPLRLNAVESNECDVECEEIATRSDSACADILGGLDIYLILLKKVRAEGTVIGLFRVMNQTFIGLLRH